MAVSQEFQRCFQDTEGAGNTGSALVPDRLCRAVVAVLPVDGASLSVAAGGSRVPLGGSDEHSSRAERLQFTVGEGPCLSAMTTGDVLDADAAGLRRMWPLLAYAWRQNTPFRSAMSVPLRLTGHARAAIDLYFTSPDGGADLDIAEILDVAEMVTEELQRPPSGSNRAQPRRAFPRWLDSPAALGRQQLWLAVGLVMTRFDLSSEHAVEQLRSYAMSQDSTLDKVAEFLVERPDSVQQLPPVAR